MPQTTTRHTLIDHTAHYKAPAKINWFLHVCGKRNDGYHNLQTAFQFLDFADDLQFTVRKDSQINLTPLIDGIATADNLIVKAAQLLQRHAHMTQGVDIHIEKHLPIGAGLGGGSSNAATSLVALNELWQCGLSTQQLQKLGLSLGADVPIFIYGHSAWAEGIGDNLTPLELPEQYYLLAIPDCQVSTAKIFSHSQLTRGSKMKKIAAFVEQGTQELSKDHFRNDCEPLVRSLYPKVDLAFKQLEKLGSARMTGTGACIFVPFDSMSEALAAQQKLTTHGEPNHPLRSIICRGINTSPLYKKSEA